MIPDKLLKRLVAHVLSGGKPARDKQMMKHVVDGQDDLIHYPGILIETVTLCGLHENNLWGHPKYNGEIGIKQLEGFMGIPGYIECKRYKISCPRCISKSRGF